MKSKSIKSKKANENNIPNMIAFGFIRAFLTEKNYSDLREEYFIGDLSKAQVNQVMSDIKWLFKNYKGLNVMTIEDVDGNLSKFIL